MHEMEGSAGQSAGRRRTGSIAAAVIGMVASCLFAVVAAEYAFDPQAYDSFFSARDPLGARRASLLVHVMAGTMALTLGALELFPGIRIGRLHRLLGQVYVVSVLTSAWGALILVPFAPGAVAGAGFGCLAVLWQIVTLTGWKHARAGNWSRHRHSMIVSYALTLAAVTLRLQLLALTEFAGVPFLLAYSIVAWSCWVPNLLVAWAASSR